MDAFSAALTARLRDAADRSLLDRDMKVLATQGWGPALALAALFREHRATEQQEEERAPTGSVRFHREALRAMDEAVASAKPFLQEVGGVRMETLDETYAKAILHEARLPGTEMRTGERGEKEGRRLLESFGQTPKYMLRAGERTILLPDEVFYADPKGNRYGMVVYVHLSREEREEAASHDPRFPMPDDVPEYDARMVWLSSTQCDWRILMGYSGEENIEHFSKGHGENTLHVATVIQCGIDAAIARGKQREPHPHSAAADRLIQSLVERDRMIDPHGTYRRFFDDPLPGAPAKRLGAVFRELHERPIDGYDPINDYGILPDPRQVFMDGEFDPTDPSNETHVTLVRSSVTHSPLWDEPVERHVLRSDVSNLEYTICTTPSPHGGETIMWIAAIESANASVSKLLGPLPPISVDLFVVPAIEHALQSKPAKMSRSAFAELNGGSASDRSHPHGGRVDMSWYTNNLPIVRFFRRWLQEHETKE